MIGFFRKIRRKLADENQFVKYSRYAIGEIVLVMVGILLALQVNNWNNEKQRNLLQKELLEHVKKDIINVNDDLISDLDLLLLGQRSFFRISEYIEKNISYQDSMCFDFGWLIRDEYIFPKITTYNRIQKEGIDIIHNDSIKMSLQYLFESLFVRITIEKQFHPNIEAYFSEYYQENFIPNSNYDLKYFEISSTDTIQFPKEFVYNGISRKLTMGFVPLDFEQLKQDSKFKVLLNRSYEYRRHKIKRYDRAKKVIQNLLPMIERELENFSINTESL